jgi:hypothetical protein
MAKIKPRVKVPKKAAAGEIVEIKALISHPMHTGRAKDKKTGKKSRARSLINSSQALTAKMYSRLISSLLCLLIHTLPFHSRPASQGHLPLHGSKMAGRNLLPVKR